MGRWWDRSLVCGGVVFFRGGLPPAPKDMPEFDTLGFTATLADPREGTHWRMKLKSDRLGRAEVFALRKPPRPPRDVLHGVIDLTPREREEALQGESAVAVQFEGRRSDLFRDRKTLLSLFGAIMGNDGVVALDHTAQRFWSRGALDDELMHDADVDIDALFNVHVIAEDDGPIGSSESGKVVWGHTHGLASIGLFDFDLIRPHAEYFTVHRDILRSVALRIAEGVLKVGGGPLLVAGNDVHVRAVDAVEFDRLASPVDRAARDSAREDHLQDRAVLCEPAPRGLARWWSKSVTPSRFFQNEPDERKPVFFSAEATELGAVRARASYPLFRSLIAELAEFKFGGLVKLGYPIDNGDPTDREHMWFSVNEARPDSIDATLSVQPFNIAKMKQGDRGTHALETMTDWLILTPVGNISPRNSTPARWIRENVELLRTALAGPGAERSSD